MVLEVVVLGNVVVCIHSLVQALLVDQLALVLYVSSETKLLDPHSVN